MKLNWLGLILFSFIRLWFLYWIHVLFSLHKQHNQLTIDINKGQLTIDINKDLSIHLQHPPSPHTDPTPIPHPPSPPPYLPIQPVSTRQYHSLVVKKRIGYHLFWQFHHNWVTKQSQRTYHVQNEIPRGRPTRIQQKEFNNENYCLQQIETKQVVGQTTSWNLGPNNFF